MNRLDADDLQAATIALWRDAGEAHDARAAAQLLSTDARLISPVTAQYAFVGPGQILPVLEAAFSCIAAIRYTDHLQRGPVVALFYEGQLHDTKFEEAQRLRLDSQGQIEELTFFLRPLPALTGLAQELGPALARRANRHRLATVLSLASTTLHRLAATGEKRLLPRTAPRTE